MHHAAIRLQLPAAFLRMRVAESEGGVCISLREDVRHVGCIALDLHGLLQTDRLQTARELRQTAPHIHRDKNCQ